MLTTFIAQIKTMLHRPAIIFWALAFPIILATMFHAMFQNIASSLQHRGPAHRHRA